jgi:hypothetical protein
MRYNDITIGGIPSRSTVYMKLCDTLRDAQDCAAMMAHLHNTENDADKLHAQGWFAIEELLKRLIHQITALAAGKTH